MSKEHCIYCGQVHDRHEDASCGCGCGGEPMACGICQIHGGPPKRYNRNGTPYEYQYGYDDWLEADYDARYEYD